MTTASTGRSPWGSARITATMMRVPPSAAPAMPTNLRGARSVTTHQAPPTKKATPTNPMTRKPRLRTEKTTTATMSSAAHPSESNANDRSRQPTS